MKHKISFLLLFMMLFVSPAVLAETTTVILDANSAKAVKTGSWTANEQRGYSTFPVLETNGGTIVWEDKTTMAPARVSYWVTVDEDGADDAVIRVQTEHLNKTFPISFNSGNSGWREIGYMNVTGLGTKVSIEGGQNGKTYVSAVKIEYLDEKFSSVFGFCNSFPEHIVLGTYSTTAYKNNQRVDIKAIPEIDGENVYVSKEAILRLCDEVVSTSDNKVIMTIDGKEFSGAVGAKSFTVDGQTLSSCLAKNIDGEVYINIAEIARKTGKQVFISKRGLVMITDKPAGYADRENKKDIMNILTSLRNEDM